MQRFPSELRVSSLSRQTAVTFSFKVLNCLLLFANGVLLARILGVADYGLFSYARGWATVLGLPALLGLDKLLVRDVAIYAAREDWGHARGLLHRSDQLVLTLSLLLASLLLGITALANRAAEPAFMLVFAVVIAGLPFSRLLALRSSALRALQRIPESQAPSLVVQPLAVLVLIGIAAWSGGGRFGPVHAAAIQLAAAVTAFLLSVRLLAEHLPGPIRSASPRYDTRRWIMAGIPMMAVAGMMALNQRIDLLMLGILRSRTEVGLYSVASRGATLIPFLLMSANVALASRVAVLHSRKETARLQALLVRSARIIFLGTVPIATALIVMGHWFLLVFGRDFVAARPALTILCFAQLFNTAAGFVGLLLMMTGHERSSAAGMAVTVALNIGMNALLIPAYGIVGAGIATGCSIIVWNVILSVVAYRRLGVFASVLGDVRLFLNRRP